MALRRGSRGGDRRPPARVIVVGEDIPLEAGMERMGLHEAVRTTLQAPALIILGDEALSRLEPTWLAMARKAAVHVLLVPRGCPGSRLAAWVRAGARDVVEPGMLAEEVARRLHHGIAARRRIEPAEWCVRQAAAGSPMDEALRLLSDVEVAHRVGAWASMSGHSRQLLWALCREELGATPTEVLLWHVEAQVKQATQRGFTLAAIAVELGYSSPSALGHALARDRA